MRRSLAGVLVVTATLSASALDGAARSSITANGQISFRSDRAANRAQVYVMNRDGSRQRAITRQFSAKRGAWSPDGRRIAFDGRAYATLFDFDVFVANADGSGARRITRGPGRDLMPAWSPDGRTIAFSRQPTEEAMPELWMVGVNGRNAHRVVDVGSHPAWSPDGSRIAFETLAGIAVARSDGSSARTLAEGGEPAWSPDGAKLLYVAGGDVWIMNAGGGDNRRLTRGAAEELSPSFSPDGRWLLFSSDRSGNKEVYVMRLDGTGLRNLTRNPAEDWATSWQPRPS